MIEGVKALGMETCVTLGRLRSDQAARLKFTRRNDCNRDLDFDHAIATARISRLLITADRAVARDNALFDEWGMTKLS